jgi:inhibitor of cysteine peptidase
MRRKLGKLFILLLVVFMSSIVIPRANIVTAFFMRGPAFSASQPELPKVGSYEKLKELLEKAEKYHVNLYRGFSMLSEAQSLEPASKSAGYADGVPDTVNRDFSATNIQVKGVDEADVVKTDGKYIYQVNNQRVVIFDAYPPEDMKIVGEINFWDSNFQPLELYLDAEYLVIIGSTYNRLPAIRADEKPVSHVYPPFNLYNTVKTIVYDIQDKKNIIKLKELDLEGFYVSSRKIGSCLYIVANKDMGYHVLNDKTQNLTPSYRDTAAKSDFVNIEYEDIAYFPESIKSNYLIVAGLDLNKDKEKAEISTFLGAGENIYASPEMLYITVTDYKNTFSSIKPVEGWEASTTIYQFSLSQGKAVYKNKSNIPGTVLNQFSMDEHEGHFRIATTSGSNWFNDERTLKNNLYVLDKNLRLTGKIENIAPGEKIYSVRFLGDRAYMVTFRTVDPLFVINLKDPTQPKILGALKIPGYSDYLHPYDENHIVGFGKDTVELQQKDSYGNVIGNMAFYKGMKIALFDVSDVKNPIEKFVEKIGDRGTDSELLRNHKALLFSRERNLLAFPVTVMQVNSKMPEDQTMLPRYGDFTFQGAYVYNLSLKNGFLLNGRITHLSDDDYLKAGHYWYDNDKNIERIIYIEDTLYTLSRGMIKAHKLTDLKQINSVIVPHN